MPVSQQHSPTLRDCVYGQAVGDALGVPYEFRVRGTFECTGMAGHGSHNQPAGTWSDDTSMALATCDSIRATGRVDVCDMRERFVRWYREGAYTVSGLFDIGGTTSSYAECVLTAVNLGNDTDTTAAVAGGLAGIAYGMSGIPAQWLNALLGKSTIDACLF